MSKLPIPPDVLTQHVIALGKTRSGKSSKMRILVEWLLDHEKPVCMIDPKGDWWGIKSSADGKRAGYPVVIFGGEHADVALNPHAGAAVAELVATGNRPALIDLGGWMVGERTRFFVDFAAAFFKQTRGARFLVIDEVHNFAPQGRVMDPDAGKMLHWANRLASEGSGKGITVLAASQRPQKVHKDFVTSMETLIACKVIHKLDRDAIKDWIDGCADLAKGKEVLQQLAGMQKPEAWVWSPEIDFGPERITWPMFKTYDSFKPRAADVGKLKGWAEVDLEDVRGKLSAAIEEAKANDPRVLRARVAELERDLAKLGKLEGDLRTAIAAPDPAATDRAYKDGYNQGHEHGFGAGTQATYKQFNALRSAAVAFRDRVSDAMAATVALPEWQDTPKPPTAPAPPKRATVADQARLDNLEHARAVKSVTGVQPRRAPSGDGTGEKLTKAERLILTALAQYPNGRSKTQVALLTGYAHTGGGFNNAVYSLRVRGLIADAWDGLQITDQGSAALGPFDPLPHGDALLKHWLRQLSKAEREVLEVLTRAYPASLSKEALARATPTGYEATGGGFNNAIYRLRSLELIRGRGELVASEDLFG